jgi:hypothetical protein
MKSKINWGTEVLLTIIVVTIICFIFTVLTSCCKDDEPTVDECLCWVVMEITTFQDYGPAGRVRFRSEGIAINYCTGEEQRVNKTTHDRNLVPKLGECVYYGDSN